MVDSSTLNVLYQSSDSYAMPTGVSMASLCENNRDIDRINFFLIDDGITKENLSKIRDVCEKYGRSLSVIDSGPIREKLRAYGVPPYHGAYTPYYKLFVIDEIDLPTDNILYIDGDIIVDGSLLSLAEKQIDESFIIAGIRDFVPLNHKEAIGIPPDELYFTTGIMLISQTNWRNHKCRDRILFHMERVRSAYPIIENDLLCVLFRNEIETLDVTYNFNPEFFLFGVENTFRIYNIDEAVYYSQDRIKEIMSEGPIINHGLGAIKGKPWNKGSRHPYAPLFDKYLRKTEWSEEDKTEISRPLFNVFQNIAYETLPAPLYRQVHKVAVNYWMKKRNKDCISEK